MASPLESPKLFGAVLTGVYRRVFEDDVTITPSFLKEQIFPNAEVVTEEVISALCSLLVKLLRQAAQDSWDVSKMESVLPKTTLTDRQKEILLKFWRVKSPLVRSVNIGKVSWENSLSSLSWRIDGQSKSRHQGDLHDEPSAIVEMKVKPGVGASNDQDESVVRFQMDRQQLTDVVAQINEIQSNLISLS
eukprot:TRINITY_DN1137_c1_g1_i1.p1 TRINITY_DN1137_c1_g1~~TRINITY_DN1137_c1_g1_i1.p1  ORF type:complete len:190 (-),score=39.53 TRINITY_DN1137_c1_g1_i1:189-758(-)